MPKARVGQLELCYESAGEGPVVLMIMGLGAQLVFWPEEFCQGLVDRGFRVVRFDNRDAGYSTRLDHLGVPRFPVEVARWAMGKRVRAPYGLEDMADDAAGLLDALEIPQAHVLGASMGGMIAQLVAIRHPKRVRSLTSIMSSPGDRRSLIPHPKAAQALFRKAPTTRREAEDSWVKFFRTVGSPGFLFDEPGLRERAGLHFERGPSPRGFARQITAVLAAPDRRAALNRLDVPALVVHGNADPLVPFSGGRRTADALRDVQFLRVEGMGHDLPRGAWPDMLDAFEHMANACPA